MSEIAQEADVSRQDKIGANDPNRTFNGLLKPRRRSVWETRLLQRSNP
jgi:hypothetical protein